VRFLKYKDCVGYLFGLERAGVKYDLINIKSLLEFLNNPQNSFKSIHIAGTNGKGSVASIINSVLIEKGFKTGLYTSPHILDFRERILVNGEYLSKKFILDFTNRIFDYIKNMDISFFEVTTAMAFEYFRYKKVKYAIVEAGLGGRLDSTNILNPVVSIITGISIDHTEYLGNSIEKIAKEKAGIIKKNVPCIIGKVNKKSEKIFIETAKRKKSELIFADKFVKPIITADRAEGFEFKTTSLNNIYYPLTGKYQLKNIATAISTLSALDKKEKIGIDTVALKKGFANIIRNSKFFGRFQKISNNPLIIIDVSHNYEALKNISDNLENINYKNLFIIFGIMKEKNHKECMSVINNLGGYLVLTKPDYKRALEPEELLKYITKQKPPNKLESFTVTHSLKEAYETIKSRIKRNDLLLVTGSFFVVSDFLKVIKLKLL
jgi:dihydrofolate synthase/folylpolyglutamate synthase